MPELILPTSRTPLHNRAYALLRAINEAGELDRPALVALNGGNVEDTKRAILFLRDVPYIYVSRYTDALEPVYRIGCEVDARRPTVASYARRKQHQSKAPVAMPAPDPLVAALFGRPATA